MQILFAQADRAIAEGRYDEAEAAFRDWMREAPSDPRPRLGLGLLLLQSGQFAEGWRYYESRHRIAELGIKKPAMRYAEWDGAPIRSLLVWPEQGFGDQIMFARWIPALVNRGVNVTLLTPPPLCRLFSGLGAEIIEARGTVEVPRHDAWCLIGSLPHLVGGFPTAPYLGGAGGGAGLGVMTAGNPTHRNDANRSLPDDPASRLKGLGCDLSPEATGARDFQDTAELVATLDRVVSVDTAVAHLAGAMGKPLDLLLPFRSDWRWGWSGTTTAWYPSARLYRQRRPGDWSAVISEVMASDAYGAYGLPAG